MGIKPTNLFLLQEYEFGKSYFLYRHGKILQNTISSIIIASTSVAVVILLLEDNILLSAGIIIFTVELARWISRLAIVWLAYYAALFTSTLRNKRLLDQQTSLHQLPGDVSLERLYALVHTRSSRDFKTQEKGDSEHPPSYFLQQRCEEIGFRYPSIVFFDGKLLCDSSKPLDIARDDALPNSLFGISRAQVIKLKSIIRQYRLSVIALSIFSLVAGILSGVSYLFHLDLYATSSTWLSICLLLTALAGFALRHFQMNQYGLIQWSCTLGNNAFHFGTLTTCTPGTGRLEIFKYMGYLRLQLHGDNGKQIAFAVSGWDDPYLCHFISTWRNLCRNHTQMLGGDDSVPADEHSSGDPPAD